MYLTLLLSPDRDVGDEELDELSGGLRRRLLDDLDINSAEPITSVDLPATAKSASVVAGGALILTLSPLVLRSVVQLVKSWLENRPVRSATLVINDDKIEVTTLSSADQRRLIESFIEGHAKE